MSDMKTSQATNLPPGTDALLELYADFGERLQFPDMSHAALLERVNELQTSEEALHEAESAVERARAALSAVRGELAVAVRRGHAYAVVYGEMNEDVRERVAAISISPPKRDTRKRSKRAKVTRAAEANTMQPLLDHAAAGGPGAHAAAKPPTTATTTTPGAEDSEGVAAAE